MGGAASSQSPSVLPEKKTKKDKPPSTKSKKSASSSTDDRFSELDAKWSERFNRLEALLMARSLEPSFSADVRVTPVHSPPATVSKDSEPFYQPSHRPVDSVAKRTGPDSDAALQLSAGKLPPGSTSQDQTFPRALAQTLLLPSSSWPVSLSRIIIPRLHQGALVQTSLLVSISQPASHTPTLTDRLHRRCRNLVNQLPTDRPSSAGLTGSESPTLPKSSGKDSISSVESDAESNFSDTPPLELFVEEGELSDEQELTEQDLPTSEEQTYRETMRGIRSFMGWTHVPDIDSSNPSDDNPFAGPKAPAPSKISVHMPTEDWLCKKLSKLNLTLVEGYPSRTAEAGSLPMDQFLRPPRPQSKWYEQQADPTKVTAWSTGHSKLNSSFGRIARKAALASTPPASRRISQDTLRRWERTAREASVVCNQTASFNCCLFKVQANMQSQIRTVRGEGKGKGSAKVSEATEELQFLMEFNSSITQAAAKAMEHLTEFDCTSPLFSRSQLSNGPKRKSHIMIARASRQLHPHA